LTKKAKIVIAMATNYQEIYKNTDEAEKRLESGIVFFN
jgi:hypothetical protein